jgi:hypothetical protein
MTNSQAVIHKSSFDTEYVSYPINGMHSERDYHYQIYFLIFSHLISASINISHEIFLIHFSTSKDS